MNIPKIGFVANINFSKKYKRNFHKANQTQNNNENMINHKFTVRKKGAISYDRTTGDYSAIIKGLLPIIVRREVHYPSKKISVVARRTSDGIIRTTQYDDKKMIQKFDNSSVLRKNEKFLTFATAPLDYENGEISRLIEYNDGTTVSYEHNKKNNTLIYIKTSPDKGREALVTDLKTGEPIESGEKIYKIYTNDDNEEIVENILTGITVQKTKYKGKTKKILYREVYDEVTSKPIYTYSYDKKNEIFTESYYCENDDKKPDVPSIEGRDKDVFVYDKNKNVVSHKQIMYGFSLGKEKPIDIEILYNPKNGDINTVTEIKKGYKKITKYSSSEKTGVNCPDMAEYISNGKKSQIYKFEKFQNEGNDLLYEINFNHLNEASYRTFDEDGNLETANYFNRNGELAVAIDYFAGSKQIASVTKYSANNRGYSQYIYSGGSKYPINIINADKNNNLKKVFLNDAEKMIPNTLLSSYFEDETYDFEWQTKASKDSSKLPQLPKNRQEILSLAEELYTKSKTAQKNRHRNFKRIF